MDLTNLIWLIPTLPLIGAILNGIVGKRAPNNVVSAIACGSVALSFCLSLGIFIKLMGMPEADLPITKDYFSWIQAGAFEAKAGILLDQLSSLMILVVTGVGLLIHIYSSGYMEHEPGFHRYFTYLNLFMFSMLTLILADNFLLMFVGWEGVGLCSYLLIGFYFVRDSATDAGKKAFVVNRIGDFGFLLAILVIYWNFESVNFQTVFEKAGNPTLFPLEALGTFGIVTTICLLLLLGATGKSAQIPLYIWLPDAMEGPTPVSALIHAATMVTAGVYMVARCALLYNQAPTAMFIVAIIGALTAIFAASIALVQTDIKRVLAYSTVSQLGYMFLACGVGAYTAAIFHLMTHAFFKALLFLGAGSLIHGLGGLQDLNKMGGLRHQMPWTFRTFLIGGMALAGFPGLAGFFSKDAILWGAWNNEYYGPLFCGVGIIVAGMTAFYTFRLVILAFFGSPRFTESEISNVHESPASMVIPLIALAFFSGTAGYLGLPSLLGGNNHIERYLQPVLGSRSEIGDYSQHLAEGFLMATSVAIVFAGIFLAYLFYSLKPDIPKRFAKFMPRFYRVLTMKYYVDEIYHAIAIRPVLAISRNYLWKMVDLSAIDGSVHATGRLIHGTAAVLRQIQTGYVRGYAVWIVLGSTLVIAWFLA